MKKLFVLSALFLLCQQVYCSDDVKALWQAIEARETDFSRFSADILNKSIAYSDLGVVEGTAVDYAFLNLRFAPDSEAAKVEDTIKALSKAGACTITDYRTFTEPSYLAFLQKGDMCPFVASDLWCAIKSKQPEQVRKVLSERTKKPVDFYRDDVRNRIDNGAVMWNAVLQTRNPEILRLFLDAGGIDFVNTPNNDDMFFPKTPLAKAVEWGYLEMVQVLLEVIAQKILQDDAYWGQVELLLKMIIPGLLEECKKQENQDKIKLNFFQKQEMASLLNARNGEPRETLLFVALSKCYLKIAQELKRYGACLAYDERESADLELQSKFFYNLGTVQPDYSRSILDKLFKKLNDERTTRIATPLKGYAATPSAVEVRIQNTIKTVLAAGAIRIINPQIFTTIGYQAMLQRKEIPSICVARNLRSAVLSDSALEVERFLHDKAGSDGLASLAYGRDFWLDPLCLAIACNNVEIVKLLLRSGANEYADALDIFGETVLEKAVKSGNLEIVKLVLDAIVNKLMSMCPGSSKAQLELLVVRQLTLVHKTLLRIALENGYGDSARYLFLRGDFLSDTEMQNLKQEFVDLVLNYSDQKGNTVVHQLVERSSGNGAIPHDQLRYLLTHLPKEWRVQKVLEVQNNEGLTPLDYARKLGRDQDVIDLLIKNGAR